MNSILNLLLVALALVHQSTCEHDRSLLDTIPITGVDTDHLTKGSPAPGPLPAGIAVRAYVMCYSPYSERVVLALTLKRIPTEIVNINLSDKPEWFTSLTPLGKVPVIEHNGNTLYESLVIVEYLDAVFTTGKKLVPTDPYEKAKQYMLLEQLAWMQVDPYTNDGWLKNRNDAEKTATVFKAYETYEYLLSETDYLAGAEPGFIDYMNWPFIQQIFTFDILSEGKMAITPQEYPKFSAYINRMKNIDELHAQLWTPERNAMFLDSVTKGTPHYDAHVADVN